MSIHHACVIPRRRCLCSDGLLQLVWLHDLEVGFGCHPWQRSCGNVPANSVFKGMNTSATLLPYSCIEYIMGYGCREIFLFSASNPNSGIRADLCIVFLVRIERIGLRALIFLLLPLLFAYVHVRGIVGLQAASQTELTRLLDCIWILRWDWFHDLRTTCIVQVA
jgi:hypothetical protein